MLDNLGELSVSRSTDRLARGIPVTGDPSQTVSMSTTKLAWVEVLVLIDFTKSSNVDNGEIISLS